MESSSRRGRRQRSPSSRQAARPVWLYHPFAELVWLAGIGWSFATADDRAAFTLLAVKAAHVVSLTPLGKRIRRR